jgi:WD40 repeat protein/uncharacterized caspase-like protein
MGYETEAQEMSTKSFCELFKRCWLSLILSSVLLILPKTGYGRVDLQTPTLLILEQDSERSFLSQRKKLRLALEAGHPASPVTSLAFSPDGKMMVIGSLDNTVKLWDLRTGGKLRTLTGHSDDVYSVAFSPDGQIIASGSYDNGVKLWDVQTGNELRTLRGHSQQVESVAFSADGRNIISGSGDTTVRVWNALTGEELGVLSGHSAAVWSVAVSPDSRIVASGSADRTVRLWNIREGTKVRTLSGNAPIASVAFSSDGLLVAGGDDAGAIRIWNIRSGELLRTIKAGSSPIRSVTFSSDGQTIASGGLDNRVKLWDLQTGKALRLLEGHSGNIFSVVVSADGRFIASGSVDTTVKLWDIRMGRELASLTAIRENDWLVVTPDCQFDASPDAMRILYWTYDLELIELNQLKQRYYEPGLLSKLVGFGETPLRGVTPFSDADLFPKIEFIGTEPSDFKAHFRLANRGGGIGRVAVLLNGKEITADARQGEPDQRTQQLDVEIDLTNHPAVIPGKDNIIEIMPYNGRGNLVGRGLKWTCKTKGVAAEYYRPQLATETGPAHQVYSVAFSPDGKILANGNQDMNIELRDVATGKQLRTLRGHSDIVMTLTFGSDGRTLASGARDGMVKLWDINSGRLLHSLIGLPGKVASIAFHHNKKVLIGGSDDGTIMFWDIETGTELFSLKRRYNIPSSIEISRSIAFSPGANFVAIEYSRGINIWDMISGEHKSSIKDHVYEGEYLRPAAVTFDPTGRILAVGHALPRHVAIQAPHKGKGIVVKLTGWRYIPPFQSQEPWAITLYHAETGVRLRALIGHTGSVRSVAFSHNGKRLASVSDDGTTRIWEVETGKQLCILKTDPGLARALAFSPDDKTLACGEGKDPFWGGISLWNVATGERLRTIERHIGDINPIMFSPDGKTVAAAGEDGIVSLWQIDRRKEPRLLKGHRDRIFSLDYSSDGRRLASGSWDQTIRLWNPDTGEQLDVLPDSSTPGDIWGGRIWSVAFSPDGKVLASGCEDSTIRLWSLSDSKRPRILEGYRRYRGIGAKESVGNETEKTLNGHSKDVITIAFNPSGNLLGSGSADNTVKLWDLSTGEVSRTLEGHSHYVYKVCFSPDGKILASGSFDQTIRLWDVTSGRLLSILKGHSVPAQIEKGTSVAFRPDGKILASGGTDGTLKLWDVAAGKEVSTFQGHSGSVASVKFSPDGNTLAAGSNDATATLWNVRDAGVPRKICSLYSFPDGSWAVIDAEGRFDASNSGEIPWMHWVVGLEPVALSQLKERYYEPGLLAKLFGLSDEPLRNVPSLEEVRLYPAVEFIEADPSNPKARLRLTNRGGGIGRVVISINGKEVTADARGSGFNEQANEQELEIDISNHPFLKPAERNICEVRTYNSEGYLASRGVTMVYDAPQKQVEPPHLWAIVAGTSNYQGKDLDLRFAAKDAEDVAKALQLGAQRLLGADRVHIMLLAAHPPMPSSQYQGKGSVVPFPSARDRPTRPSLLLAFEEARQAKSTDILVIYLAGHGINQGGQNGDYYYLTSDARTGDLNDPAVRSMTAISSEELTALVRQIPALKQVLILDTCAAGRLVEKLTEKRTVPSSQIRALDRLKDRMGLYILAGSTADAVSYESSRYGQGILTYSLLLGMRGAALREGEFIDVGRLFEFASDRVPQIAKDIGGIQRPLVAIPYGGSSFDIGQLTEPEKQQIPVAKQLPLVLRAHFQDEIRLLDHLGLTKRVNSILREKSAMGFQAPLVFLDVDEFPDALVLEGRYRMGGDEVKVTVHLFRNGESIGDFAVDADRSDLLQVAAQIVEGIMAKVQHLN